MWFCSCLFLKVSTKGFFLATKILRNSREERVQLQFTKVPWFIHLFPLKTSVSVVDFALVQLQDWGMVSFETKVH